MRLCITSFTRWTKLCVFIIGRCWSKTLVWKALSNVYSYKEFIHVKRFLEPALQQPNASAYFLKPVRINFGGSLQERQDLFRLKSSQGTSFLYFPWIMHVAGTGWHGDASLLRRPTPEMWSNLSTMYRSVCVLAVIAVTAVIEHASGYHVCVLLCSYCWAQLIKHSRLNYAKTQSVLLCPIKKRKGGIGNTVPYIQCMLWE